MGSTARFAHRAAPSEASEILRCVNLHKSFGELKVLKGIDLAVHKGEVVAIIGASGSGKSTLLRCINLLEQPTSGDIVFVGAPVDYRPRALFGSPSAAWERR